MTGADETIRLALVNDYEVVVRGLVDMLREYDDLEVVELDVNKPVASRVDVALYDTFAQTQGDGDDVAALVANPLVEHVVVYSWNLESGLLERSVSAGISGYLSKGMTAADLADALRKVARGERITSESTDDEVEQLAGDWPGREEGLTARESEVLGLITQGMSNKEIASLTHLSINSVKTYIRHAYQKIGVDSRSKAVLWGIDHGFRPDVLRERVR